MPTTFSQLVIWTALPDGTLPGNPDVLQISVAVSPRLASTGAAPQMLGSWPDWLDWPAHSLSFNVHIGARTIPSGSVTLVPPPVPLPTGVTPSQLWQILFGSTTDVTPYEFAAFSGQLIRSYPAWNVRDFLWSTYTQIASQYPSDYPPYSALVGETEPQWFGQLPINSQSLQAVVDQIDSALASSGGAIPPGAPDPATDVVQAWLYSQPLAPGSPAKPPPAPVPTQPDFHQMLSTLGKYPVLLRTRAGVRPPGGTAIRFGRGGPAERHSYLDATSIPAFRHAECAACSADQLLDLPRRRSADQRFHRRAGSCASTPSWRAATPSSRWSRWSSTDPRPSRSISSRASPNAVTVRQSWDTPQTYAVPSLRSGGVTLLHTGTAADFVSDQVNEESLNTALESLSPLTLYAEDVMQGYRIDVYDETGGRWYQLCARVAAGTVYGGGAPKGYVIGKGAGAVTISLPEGTAGTAGPGPGETGAPFDEGWVELSLTQSPPGVSPASDLYLHEKLCRWDGWSLVASRPGKHWAETSNTPATNAYNSDNPTKLALRIAHAAAPATLPLLRFGRTYRVRARGVDLAGNSLDFTSAAPASSLTHATSALVYGRFEPVATPVCVPTAPRTPGEHLLNVVIRSETYDSPPSTVTPSYRHVEPPSTSAELAERHGMFDVAGSPSGSVATYELIADSVGLTYATPSVVSSLGGVLDSSWVNALWPEDVYYYPSLSCPAPICPTSWQGGRPSRTCRGRRPPVRSSRCPSPRPPRGRRSHP